MDNSIEKAEKINMLRLFLGEEDTLEISILVILH